MGFNFSSSGTFQETKSNLYNKSIKAAFKIYRDTKPANPSIQTLLHLFDHTVKPILLYGSEIWGSFSSFSKRIRNKSLNLSDIYEGWEVDKLHYKFSKMLLGVNKFSSNLAVVSELGRFPLYINLVLSLFIYWFRLENTNNKLLQSALYTSTDLYTKKNIFTWYTSIDLLSNKLKLNLQYLKQCSLKKCKSIVISALKAEYLDTWNKSRESSITSGSGKLSTYFQIKTTFGREPYLSLLSFHDRVALTKFRISAHRLRIQTGRYQKTADINGQLKILDRSERLCPRCTLDKIEDEFHFIMECPFFNIDRSHFMSYISNICNNFQQLDIYAKFLWIMTNEDKDILTQLAIFIKPSLAK